MGTITLRAETLNAVLYDILRSLIHHGWNKLILVNGHGSNVKVLDPLLRRIKYETGALVALYKPYAERYIGILEGLLDNPPEETPGWHASELETSQVMAHDARMVHMDRAADDRAQAPEWLPKRFLKSDGAPDVQFEGYQYFSFPMDHGEFSRTGVIGNPMTATPEKGEEALERFSDHLARAIDEFRGLGRAGRASERSRTAYEHRPARPAPRADPRAHPARRRRLRRRPGARPDRLLDHGPPRPRAAVASDGLVERVHGGARAMPAAGPPTAIPPTGWEQRAAVARGAKATIAAHAAREVRSGSTIFLDSSSSCLALARQLVSEPATELTLVTNSPAIAYELRRRADPRDRHAGRAGPAHAAAGRALDDRLPVRAELRARVLLGGRA